jgi:dTMP kinase
MFFSFDGVDGAGKTTQIRLFVEWLREQGREVLECVDPGSTPLGEKVREIVLGATSLRIDTTAEMLLFMAARAQLVSEVIQPALDEGKVVVSDRYLLANIVYQGHAGGMEVADVSSVGQVATNRLIPDLTFVLDMDPASARGRRERELDRMESKGLEYLQRVRSGFQAEAAQDERIVIVDAAREIETVHLEIQAAAAAILSAS